MEEVNSSSGHVIISVIREMEKKIVLETVPELLNLKTSEVSTESFRVTWEHSAQDVVLYRLTWTPTRGGDTKEMLVNGNMNTYLLTGLIPNTEYKVAVSSTFRDKFESDDVTIKESTAIFLVILIYRLECPQCKVSYI
ncbi:collagen alpha-1(XII) chain-like isoform X4 [Oncorhynchus masou masou]